jgi:heme-degrading monooxygenase HmoA
VSGGPARVLVYATAPADGPNAVTEAYHRISRDLLGTPGLLANELLQSAHDPAAYAVASYWTDLAAFSRWEAGQQHRAATAPLRPYQTPGLGAGVYQVVSAYPGHRTGGTG